MSLREDVERLIQMQEIADDVAGVRADLEAVLPKIAAQDTVVVAARALLEEKNRYDEAMASDPRFGSVERAERAHIMDDSISKRGAMYDALEHALDQLDREMAT